MKTRKPLLIFIFSFFSLISIGQSSYDSTKVSGLIRLFVNRLAEDTLVQISTSDGKIVEPEYSSYGEVLHQFIKRGKDYEFIKLMKHSNPVIRCYAFEGLVYSGSSKIIEVLEAHFDDTVKLWTRQGCVLTPGNTPIEIMMDLARGGRIIDRKEYPETATDKEGEDFIQKLTIVFEKFYKLKKE